MDASALNLRSLQERIGIVSQEIFLFDDSIITNIRYRNSVATEVNVYAVSKQAYAHELITAFQDGYQAKVVELGVKLSIGQKQRISFARALLKNPDILKGTKSDLVRKIKWQNQLHHRAPFVHSFCGG